jgi:hypothetical protein
MFLELCAARNHAVFKVAYLRLPFAKTIPITTRRLLEPIVV